MMVVIAYAVEKHVRYDGSGRIVFVSDNTVFQHGKKSAVHEIQRLKQNSEYQRNKDGVDRWFTVEVVLERLQWGRMKETME